MRRIVLSGVSLVDMGPAVVFRSALQAAVEFFGSDYEIVALVHRKDLFSVPGVRFIEFPSVRRSWLKRLRFEYITLKSLSMELKADLWLSMHDMTPNVKAIRRAVYCHNPSPFYSLRLRDALVDRKFAAFVLLYGLLYRINIRKNDAVIVQQDWIRSEFQKRYALKNVIVAHPTTKLAEDGIDTFSLPRDRGCYRFFYPSFPRPFKNAEVILDAVTILERESVGPFELWLTLDDRINRYARGLVKKYGHLRSVKWLGVLQHAAVLERYKQTDCLVFSSKLETWGLPITEFKATKRPLIVADLPYARETVGSYSNVAFFKEDNAVELAALMKGAISGENVFETARGTDIASPFADGWPELWKLLLSKIA